MPRKIKSLKKLYFQKVWFKLPSQIGAQLIIFFGIETPLKLILLAVYGMLTFKTLLLILCCQFHNAPVMMMLTTK